MLAGPFSGRQRVLFSPSHSPITSRPAWSPLFVNANLPRQSHAPSPPENEMILTTEATLEHVARARAGTERVRHVGGSGVRWVR